MQPEFSLEAFDLDAKTVRLRFESEAELHAYVRKFFQATKGALAPKEALLIPPEPLDRVTIEAECGWVQRWLHNEHTAAEIKGAYDGGRLEVTVWNDDRVVREKRYRVTVEEIAAPSEPGGGR